jgi:hypothetical protein
MKQGNKKSNRRAGKSTSSKTPVDKSYWAYAWIVTKKSHLAVKLLPGLGKPPIDVGLITSISYVSNTDRRGDAENPTLGQLKFTFADGHVFAVRQEFASLDDAPFTPFTSGAFMQKYVSKLLENGDDLQALKGIDGFVPIEHFHIPMLSYFVAFCVCVFCCLHLVVRILKSARPNVDLFLCSLCFVCVFEGVN